MDKGGLISKLFIRLEKRILELEAFEKKNINLRAYLIMRTSRTAEIVTLHHIKTRIYPRKTRVFIGKQIKRSTIIH